MTIHQFTSLLRLPDWDIICKDNRTRKQVDKKTILVLGTPKIQLSKKSHLGDNSTDFS